MHSFDDFKKWAKDPQLSSYEKNGFSAQHREVTEGFIFPDVQTKMSNLALKGAHILEIGCGSSKPVNDLLQNARENQQKVVLMDSQEQLDAVPDKSSSIIKIILSFATAPFLY